MAQSGYTPILIYASSTPGALPSAANLTSSASGAELAINYADGKLYFKNSSGVVTLLAGSSSGPAGGSNTQVQYNSSGVLAGSSNLTFDGTSLTLGGNPTLSAGAANGVLYLNGSKVATSGSALTFDAARLSFIKATNGRSWSPDGDDLLAIENSGSANFDMRASTTGGSYVMFSDTDARARGYVAYLHSSDSMPFAVAGSEAMRLTSTGLGIGTSSPWSQLTVGSGGAANPASTVTFHNTTANEYRLKLTSATYNTNGAWLGLGFGYSDNYLKAAIIAECKDANARTNLHFCLDANSNSANAELADSKMVLTYDGNLGLGVTPSAWSQGRAFEVFQAGYGVWNGTGSAYLLANTYYNSGFKYAASSVEASHYYQYQGAHVWSTAASGTAGNAISFTQAMTLDASGNLGVGTTSITDRLTVVAATGTTFLSSSTNTNQAYHKVNNAGGNVYFGVNNSANTFFAASAYAGIVWHDGNYPLVFGTNNTERARITSGGDLLVGTTGNTRAGVVAYFASNDIFNSHSGAAAGAITSLYTGWYGATSTTTGTLSFNVTTNGNVTNTNNSYGGISDAKLKENIVDASPKLADLMQVRVRNYNFKEGQTHKQIGVVAQELEQIFPSMVNESPDRDADGNDLGTTTKQVKYSVFVPMLIKAIQEQQTLIESLTSRVAQLEGTQP